MDLFPINHFQDGRPNMKRKRLNAKSFSVAILDCLAAGHDEILAGFINPRKALSCGSQRVLNDYFGNAKRGRVNAGLKRLQARGSVKVSSTGITLTEIGWEDHLVAKIRDANTYSDGRSLMIMFDIPESRRNDRNQLRRLLVSAGCIRLQQSVYATPFNILNDLTDILQKVDLYHYVRMYYTELAV